MSYNGYLIQVGSFVVTKKYIAHDSYTVTRNTQDLDSYRDANGQLHRYALPMVADKVEFDTPYITDTDVDTLFANFRANYVSQIERSAYVSLYIPELNIYQTELMYLSNPEISIYQARENRIIYDPIRIAFIGYGVGE